MDPDLNRPPNPGLGELGLNPVGVNGGIDGMVGVVGVDGVVMAPFPDAEPCRG
jgi:hypothetical protein